MPARNANRGRGGGRGKGGNRPSSTGGRQANARASSAPSSRGGSGGSVVARGGRSAGGRASSRTTATAEPSRTTAGAGASSVRGGGTAASSARSGGGSGAVSRSASTGASADARGAVSSAERSAGARPSTAGAGASRRGTGVASAIAGGDIGSGGIATTAPASASAPRASDVDAALFGGGASTERPRVPDRQRDLEPAREARGTRSEAATTAGGTQAAAGVAGRPQATRGLPAWLAGSENPFGIIRRMQEDLETVFRAIGIPRFGAALAAPRELEQLLARTPALSETAQWSPQIEVFERDGDLVVHADLPGVKRDDVEVNVNNDVLTIRGQRRQENREAEGGYRRTERSYGTFFRQILLPDGVDPTQIEAAYQDGVLEVVVPSPRTQQQIRRRVDIR